MKPEKTRGELQPASLSSGGVLGLATPLHGPHILSACTCDRHMSCWRGGMIHVQD